MSGKKKIITGLLMSLYSLVLAETAGAQGILSLVTKACSTSGVCSLCDLISVGIRFTQILLGLTGVAALAMFVYGGMLMITAYGNEKRVADGKNTIIAAVIGIVIILTAWILVNTVYQALGYTGANGAWNVCNQK